MKRLQFNASDTGKATPQQYERPALSCYADGCCWKGSASYDGRYFCVAHLGVEEAEMWPRITSKTAEFKWLADFIAEIQRAINSQAADVKWLEFCDSFWIGSDYPELAPNLLERTAPNVYVYRLIGEARAMARGMERPKRRVPHGQSADWQKAQRRATTAGLEGKP